MKTYLIETLAQLSEKSRKAPGLVRYRLNRAVNELSDAIGLFAIDPDEQEVWQQIPSCLSYEASTWGNIRNIHTKKLKPIQINSINRRRIVSIRLNHSRATTRLVSLLIAEAFYGPRPTGYHTHHLDGNRQNDKPSNLEYVPRGNHPRAAWPYRRNNTLLK